MTVCTFFQDLFQEKLKHVSLCIAFPEYSGSQDFEEAKYVSSIPNTYLSVLSISAFPFSPNPRLLFLFLLTLSSPTSYLPFFYKLFTLAVFVFFSHLFLSAYFLHSFSFPMFLFSCADIFKLLRSPGSDSKKLILPTYVAWRAGTTTLFLLGS